MLTEQERLALMLRRLAGRRRRSPAWENFPNFPGWTAAVGAPGAVQAGKTFAFAHWACVEAFEEVVVEWLDPMKPGSGPLARSQNSSSRSCRSRARPAGAARVEAPPRTRQSRPRRLRVRGPTRAPWEAVVSVNDDPPRRLLGPEWSNREETG